MRGVRPPRPAPYHHENLFPSSHYRVALLAAQPTLWYDQPAKIWTDALPVGNGRLGAMVFGGIGHERIQFNEDTVWTGEPHDYAHKGAASYLPADPRTALGRQAEGGRGSRHEGVHERADPPARLPGLRRSGHRHPGRPRTRPTTARSLDLDTAIAATEFTAGGVTYRREVFASYPANAIVIRLTAGKPGSVDLHRRHQGRARELQGQSRHVQRTLPHRPARGSADPLRSPPAGARRRRQGQREGSPTGHRRSQFRHPDPGRRHQFQELPRRLRRSRRSATPPPSRPLRKKVLRRPPRRTHPRSPGALPPRHPRPRHLARRRTAHRPAHRRLRQGQRPRAGRPAVPVRPLPADRLQPPRRPAGQPAGHLERLQQARLGQQVHRQHQHRDELLAGRSGQPAGVPVAPVRRAEGPLPVRRRRRQGAVQRPRLGGAPQFRPVARRRADQRQQPRHLADRRRLALHPPVGAIPVHAGQAVPARHRLSR